MIIKGKSKAKGNFLFPTCQVVKMNSMSIHPLKFFLMNYLKIRMINRIFVLLPDIKADKCLPYSAAKKNCKINQ